RAAARLRKRPARTDAPQRARTIRPATGRRLAPLYLEPHGRERLSLIGELRRAPTRDKVEPGENQLSATLAWLADHSDAFARALGGCCSPTRISTRGGAARPRTKRAYGGSAHSPEPRATLRVIPRSPTGEPRT